MGALVFILTCAIPCALVGFGAWVGMRSQRIMAVRHGLARWVPDEFGWSSFVWRNSLASEHESVIRDRDYYRTEYEKAQAVIRELKSKQK